MKCNYCDFEYNDDEEYREHLNATHFRCAMCGEVFDNDQFEWDESLCDKCFELYFAKDN